MRLIYITKRALLAGVVFLCTTTKLLSQEQDNTITPTPDTTIYLTKDQSVLFQNKLIAHYGFDLTKWSGGETNILSNYRIGRPTATSVMSICVKENTITIAFNALPDKGKLNKAVVEYEIQKLILGFELSEKELGNSFTITIDLHPSINIKTYNSALRKETKSIRWSIGLSTSVDYVYRTLNANPLGGDLSTHIENRDRNEYSFVKPQFNISVGGSFGSHRTSFGFGCIKLGYLFDTPGDVDVTSGLFITGNEQKEQISRFYSFSLNYQYLSYNKKFAPYFMTGLNVTYGGETNEISNLPNRYFGTSLKSAFGLTYNPCYHWSFHFAPTGLVFLNSRKHEQINARFYSLGLEIGAVFNLSNLNRTKCPKKRTKTCVPNKNSKISNYYLIIMCQVKDVNPID